MTGRGPAAKGHAGVPRLECCTQAIRERVGKRGVSAYLEKAAQRKIERDNLDELIADFDKVHGPADPEAVAAKRATLTDSASDAGAAA